MTSMLAVLALTGFLLPASCGSGALPPGRKDLMADTRLPAMPALADGNPELLSAMPAAASAPALQYNTAAMQSYEPYVNTASELP